VSANGEAMLKRLRASFKGQRRAVDDSAIPSVAPVDSRARARNKSEGAVPHEEGATFPPGNKAA